MGAPLLFSGLCWAGGGQEWQVIPPAHSAFLGSPLCNTVGESRGEMGVKGRRAFERGTEYLSSRENPHHRSFPTHHRTARPPPPPPFPCPLTPSSLAASRAPVESVSIRSHYAPLPPSQSPSFQCLIFFHSFCRPLSSNNVPVNAITPLPCSRLWTRARRARALRKTPRIHNQSLPP